MPRSPSISDCEAHVKAKRLQPSTEAVQRSWAPGGMESDRAISGLAERASSWSARLTGLLVTSWSPRLRVPGERPQTPADLPGRAGGPCDLHVFGGVFRC